MRLKWTEVAPPCEECRYHHVSAQTPFGRFLITWKGWKDYPSYDVEEAPWTDQWWYSGSDLDDAKMAAETEMNKRIQECLKEE